MAEKKTFYDVDIAAENKPPIASISPVDQSNGLGAMIKLDGRDSYDPEGQPLTYFWEFLDVPKGSKVEKLGFTYLEADNSVVSFQPDKIGVYKVGLIVNDGQLDSQQAEALSYIQLSLSPVCTDIVEDASFIWQHLSDFWQKVRGRDRYETIWSTMIQAIADELLRAYQLDYSKSIKTIPDYMQRRWQFYSPRLDISDWDNAYIVIGNEGAGITGKTGALGESGKLVFLSADEVLLVNGVASPKHIGMAINILTSMGDPSNIGSYEIISLLGNGYKLSPATLLPNYQGEEKFSGFYNTSVGAQTINIVGGGLLSLDPLPVVGDIVGISEGYFQITEVADTYVRIAEKLKNSVSGDGCQIFAAAFYETVVEEEVSTATFSIDLFDYDFARLNTSELSGNIKVTGPREVAIPHRMYFEEAVGRLLTIKDGRHKGTYTILATTPGGNGYILAAKFKSPFSDTQSPATLAGRTSASGRLLIADQRAATIANIYTDERYVSPRSIAVVDQAALPAGYSGVTWRVPNVLVAEENLEALGVRTGDILHLEFYRTEYPDAAVSVYFYVVGVDRNRLGFVFADGEPHAGVVPRMADEDIKSLADTLAVDGVKLQADVLSYSGIASVLDMIIKSGNWQNKYYNTELRQLSEIAVGDFSFTFKFKEIIRHSRVAVSSDVVSIPCLKEYIKPPMLVDNTDTVEILVGDDIHTVDSVTPTLVENRDYVIESEQDIFGTDGLITAGNSTVELPYAALIARDVESRDVLNILDGPNLGSYEVTKIISEEKLEVIPAPEFADTRAKYVITRTNPGRFIRFVPGVFDAQNLPPARLWGEVTFLDNTKAIEDNFGWMVNVLKSDLDAVGSTADYRLAVAGVMYAWTTGSSLRNIEIGTQILFGLPFAETAGIIVEIDKSYQLDDAGEPILGRILLEETVKGERTGRIRAYFYPPAVIRVDPLTGDSYSISDAYTTGVAVNDHTGEEYKEGDAVEQFSPLTKGARVQDYIDDPAWFLMGSYRSVNEVKKVHTFRVRTNSDLVDTLAADFVYQFLFAIKPVWTNFLISIIKSLQDEVELDENCKLKGTLLLYDTPGYSVEPCIRLNNYNESSQFNFALPEFETGMANTRTLQEGNSLTTTNGTAVVQVEGNLITPPVHSPVDEPLTRWYDTLVIRDGQNKGKYTIAAVLSDGSMRLDTGAGTFWGVHPEHLVSLSDQTYQILREHTAPILAGHFDSAAGNLLIDADATWWVDGVVAGDVLVIHVGVNRGRWPIARLLPPVPPAEVISQLEIEGTFTAPQFGDSYEIQRPALQRNPVDSFTNVQLTALSEWVQMGVTNLDCSQIQVGDYFYAHNKRFKITDIERPSGGPLFGSVAVSPIPTANWNEPFVDVLRDHQGVTFDTVEWNIPEDELRMTLIPVGGKLGVTAISMAGSNIVDFSHNIFTDLNTVAGDNLILYAPSLDEGEHVIAEIIFPWRLRLTRDLVETNWGLVFGLKTTV